MSGRGNRPAFAADSFTVFLYRQRQRLRESLDRAEVRIHEARVDAAIDRSPAWETRGQVTGYGGRGLRRSHEE